MESTTLTPSGSAAERKVTMTSTHAITISAKAARGDGDLDGHKATCTCGFTATTSLSEHEARKLGFAHVAWATKAGR
jgi:hypothetical protein